MNPAVWELEDEDPDTSLLAGRPAPTLVSMHFIRSALRRKRFVLGLLMTLGLLLGSVFLLLVPPSHVATAALALSHDPKADPDSAMLTDVSLATTRAVATQVIDQLKLDESPISLLGRVTAEPTTTDILTLSLSAGSDQDATRELAAYTSVFLSFRAEQLTRQAELLSQGTNQQIDALQKKADAVTQQIDASGIVQGGDNTEVSELISQRAQYVSQISTMQQSVQDSTLQTTAIVAASRIIDQAAATPSSALKRPVLVLLTALIGFTGLGAAVILFRAIVSDRLRTRVEVATALEVPISTSLGKVTPLPAWIAWIAWMPFLRGLMTRRQNDLQRFARAIEVAIPEPGQGQWLAVACVDNARDVSWGAVTTALELGRRGRVVRLVDLTDEGVVEGVVDAILAKNPGPRPITSRPRMSPSLARDASDIVTFGPETRDMPAMRDTDIFITVVDLNPSVGAFHVTSWTQRLIVVVSAGQSSAERVRTAADLVQTAGLDLRSGILIDTEPGDVSSVNPIPAVYSNGS